MMTLIGCVASDCGAAVTAVTLGRTWYCPGKACGISKVPSGFRFNCSWSTPGPVNISVRVHPRFVTRPETFTHGVPSTVNRTLRGFGGASAETFRELVRRSTLPEVTDFISYPAGRLDQETRYSPSGSIARNEPSGCVDKPALCPVPLNGES